ncbi:hypothetical protein O6H91_20G013700 [Diphasiastrum complanatum]|uniref:Uncharacterized protein n=1 Tax=Diphasiastrum complanatum TaxID=34168 RepID=A0ACC2AN71_DIPCM|nr:hypothetical protein O6H91_20G013700 [Diphasiastrum complanatum]
MMMMEGSSEEEHEHFESAEDISSTSDSDSQSEGEDPPFKEEESNQARKPPRGAAPPQPKSSLAYESRYAVWRNHPRTISERRRELFQLMGLQDEREYRKESHSSDSSSVVSVSGTELDEKRAQYSRSTSFSLLPASGSSSASSESSEFVSALQNTVGFSNMNGRMNVGPQRSGGIFRSASLDEVCTKDDPSWSVTRTRSDGKGRDKLPRGIKSGAATPDRVVFDRIFDTSGAVLRETSDYSPHSEVQKQMYSDSLRQNQKKGSYGIRDHFQMRTSVGSSPRSKVEASPTLEPWTGPSSSSERSVADVSQGGEDHMEDPSFSVDTSKELVCRVKDLDTGKEFVVHELGTDGVWNKLREVSTGKELTLEEFERSLGLSPIVQEVRKREWAAGLEWEKEVKNADADEAKHKKKGWLRSIKNVAKYVKGAKEKSVKDSYKGEVPHKNGYSHYESFNSKDGLPFWQPQKVKVRAHKKASKEFSDLYMGQQFRAHQGPIWALKFSTDGHYLATGGQDCVVRIWEIKDHHPVEDGESNLMGSDSSDARLEETGSLKGLKSLFNRGDGRHSRTCSIGRNKNENAKVIQLPKVFLIVEKAARCFHGHTKDVLDLAWSQSQFLVSSSMDKTVRLWHILHDECLKIFSHRDYVTCIEFNPVDDRYFLSGSLDDKLRIWSIIDHQVVDWVDLREMVTAACYTPDGKGAVVGSCKGTWRMYKITGNKLEMEANINVLNKKGKKIRGKKITGLEYMPGNPHRLLVTSSDSRIRVYDDLELNCKLKGFRNANSQISASFSTQGNYIVTASEDSHVYIWNSDAANAPKGQRKHKNQAYEGFYSQNVTIAISWPGTAPLPSVLQVNKEESEAESVRQCGESVSPCHPKSHSDSGNSAFMSTINQDVHGFCGGSNHGKIASRQSKLSIPFLKSPNRERTGNNFDRINHMCGMHTSMDNGTRTNVWPSEGICLCQDLTANISPARSLAVQDSVMLDSGSISVSERKACHYSQSPMFDKVYGSCDNVPKVSATWPEEKLPLHSCKFSPRIDMSETSGSTKSMTAENLEETVSSVVSAVCDLVIVTASLEGDLRTFQNYRLL